jgi:hypothetical protein
MRTKQVRPEKTQYEFELHISMGTESITKRTFVLFDFRTVKIFENFVYKLTVETKLNMDKKEMHFNMEGLSAPTIDLSKNGYAYFKYKLFDFKNTTYLLKLTKNRKIKCTSNLVISKNNIKLSKFSGKPFIKIIIN